MNVESRLKEFLTKSAEVSKNVFSKAGDAVQEFSDKSVVKIDKIKLENQKSKKLTDLGQIVYDLFSDSQTSVSFDNENIKSLFEEITQIEKNIEEKTELLKNYGTSDESDKNE